METLEIHSRSFLIKWVSAPAGSVITWQVKANKKSIQFGIYLKNDGKTPDGDVMYPPSSRRERSGSVSSTLSIEDRLEKNGLTKVHWQGRCAAEEFVKGRYEVESNGVYALIFDNTFSKNTAKTVLFGYVVERKEKEGSSVVADTPTPRAVDEPKSTCVSDGRYLRGQLMKKRRKRMQGHARRFFTLDYKQGVLNYYLTEKSSLLRGSMPINLCAVTARESSREIFIDSGMEVWSLRALSVVDFRTWVQALDVARAIGTNAGVEPPTPLSAVHSNRHSMIKAATMNSMVMLANDDEDWSEIRSLVARLESTRDMARVGYRSMSIASQPPPQLQPGSPSLNHEPASPPLNGESSRLQRRPSFWKRRASRSKPSSSEKSPQLGGTSPNESANTSAVSLIDPVPTPSTQIRQVSDDLERIVAEFQQLIKQHDATKQAAVTAAAQQVSRLSFDGAESVLSDEYFDANDDFEAGVVYFDDGAEVESIEEVESDDDDSSIEENALIRDVTHTSAIPKHDLYPLPILDRIPRRKTIGRDNGSPPSLITILRKNVGKDMTSIPMPVTLNEPISLIQALGEFLQYSDLLDRAVASTDVVERAMLIACFSLSYVSAFRAKERCVRKPFNPLLGETYELVREDKGFRLVAEKVSHRPVIIAIQAESTHWTLNYTAIPAQKFWGKSMQITDSGPVRITINKTGERFEFLLPSMFMRNLIAGEKYVEPVGNCTIYSTSGTKAVVEYKAGGMFSGRSEELTVKGYKPDGTASAQHVFAGKWTDSVVDNANHTDVWHAGPLVADYKSRYGFSEWTAGLNEITDIEQNAMAPTDSRLRPDQRAYENGDTQTAESQKLALEQAQRERRSAMEKSHKTHEPAFFEKVDGQFYELKTGDANYWKRRQVGNWEDLTPLW